MKEKFHGDKHEVVSTMLPSENEYDSIKWDLFEPSNAIIWCISIRFFKLEQLSDITSQLDKWKSNKKIIFVLFGENQKERFPLTNNTTKSEIFTYWEDRYLFFRKQKRKANPEIINIDHRLRSTRYMSGEIKEIMELTLSFPKFQWLELMNSDFHVLFLELGLEIPANPLKEPTQQLTNVPPKKEKKKKKKAKKKNTLNAAAQSFKSHSISRKHDDHEDDLLDSILDEIITSPSEKPTEIHTPTYKNEESPTLLAPLSSKEKDNMKNDTLSTAEKLDGYNDAQRAFKAGKIEDGLHHLEGIIKKYPRDPALRVHYAKALLTHRNALEAAAEHLRQSLMLDPEHEDALLLQAELYEARDMPQQAMRYYKKLAALNPSFPDVYARMAMLGSGVLDSPDEDLLEWTKLAMKYDKNVDTELYFIQANALEGIGKPDEAMEALEALVKFDPDHAFGYYQMALIHYRNENFAEAQTAYEKAAQLNLEFKTPQNDAAFLKPTNTAAATSTTTAPSISGTINTDQTVLITGATSGIGFATAKVFAREGYRLVITGRRKERLDDLKKALIANYDVDIKTLTFDVRDHAAAKKEIGKLRGAFRKVNILINNAGLAKGLAPIHEGNLDHWETMIDTNIKGLLYMTRLVTPGMVKRGQGHVINIASTAGKEVYPNGNVYCATKFAVDALTKGMRLDLHKHGIRVSQVAPAHVEETEFALVRFDGNNKKAKIYDDFQPLKANDVAETIFFIATRPPHVNIQDVVMMGTQQASSTVIDRSGRDRFTS